MHKEIKTETPIPDHKDWTPDMYEKLDELESIDDVISFLISQFDHLYRGKKFSLLTLPSYLSEYSRIADTPKQALHSLKKTLQSIQNTHDVEIFDHLPIEPKISKWLVPYSKGVTSSLVDEELVVTMYTRLFGEGRVKGLDGIICPSQYIHYDSVRKKIHIAGECGLPVMFLNKKNELQVTPA